MGPWDDLIPTDFAMLITVFEQAGLVVDHARDHCFSIDCEGTTVHFVFSKEWRLSTIEVNDRLARRAGG